MIRNTAYTIILMHLIFMVGQAQQVMNYEQLKYRLATQSDSLYVVNFWATWCGPCVEELPYFEQLNEQYSDKPVKVLLVSLDFPKQLTTRLQPFIKERNIKSEVILLDDPRSYMWIDSISREWSGALPATLMFTNTNRWFYERNFTYEELENEVKPKINK